jgi:hypothetical protein
MKISLIIVLLAIPVLAFSQKAFEAIYYRGSTENISVKFILANGYITASEIQTINRKTKRMTKFLPVSNYAGNNSKMKFYHYSPSGKKFSDYFILENIEEYSQHVPAKILGKYFLNRTAYNIILTKHN